MITFEETPNVNTYDAICKCARHIMLHNNIMVSISGGADSDIMLDLIIRVAKDNNVDMNKFHFVWFDTGIEYMATKEHLNYLENKYGIIIERIRPKFPVPRGCAKYGLPFMSKYISEMIERLQKHNFDFNKDGNKTFDELYKKYPKCKIALKWWCNENGEKSSFNINRNKLLKEFMIVNPPDFKISNKCCMGAKKKPSHEYIDNNLNIDMKCLGLRRAEGGGTCGCN